MAKLIPIANRVKECRTAHNEMTQTELGDAVGVTRQTIAAIEQRRYSPSLETAFRIANLFDKNVDEIFYWQEPLD